MRVAARPTPLPLATHSSNSVERPNERYVRLFIFGLNVGLHKPSTLRSFAQDRNADYIHWHGTHRSASGSLREEVLLAAFCALALQLGGEYESTRATPRFLHTLAFTRRFHNACLRYTASGPPALFRLEWGMAQSTCQTGKLPAATMNT